MGGAEFLGEARAFYDALAEDYEDRLATDLTTMPVDRGMLAAFAELVGAGPVADVGCGPGRVTAHLASLGLEVRGIDLSPVMVALARRRVPGLRFDEGSMTDLDAGEGSLAGVVAYYSLIHIPAPHRPAVVAEFHRVLAPGGHLLLAFQVGDEILHVSAPDGRPVSVDVHRLDPEAICALLAEAGFSVVAQMIRAPAGPERVPQAVVLARRADQPDETSARPAPA